MDNITKSKDSANGYTGIAASGKTYLINRTGRSSFQRWVATNKDDIYDTFCSGKLWGISENLKHL